MHLTIITKSERIARHSFDMSKAQVNKLFADTKSLEEKGKTLEARNLQWFNEAENYIRYLDAENEKVKTLEVRNLQWFNQADNYIQYLDAENKGLKERVDQLEKIIGENLPGVALQSASQRQT